MTIETSPGVRKKRRSSCDRNSSIRSSSATASSASRASWRAVNDGDGVSTQLTVPLDLDRLLEGWAVLPRNQRRLDRRRGLVPDHVQAELIVALARGIGGPDRRLLVTDLVVAVDLVVRRVDGLCQRRREHRAALLELSLSAVDAREAALDALHAEGVAQVLLHLAVDRSLVGRAVV